MAIRVAINGFGRIGQAFLRAVLSDKKASQEIEIVAINQGPNKSEHVGLFFKYDSVMGQFPGNVTYKDGKLTIGDRTITVLSEKDPDKCAWGKLAIDWVVEASGCFRTKELAGLHVSAGSKKVLITAPSQDSDVTIIPGVNDNAYKPNEHAIVSLGSCTTNCFAPIIKVIKENFDFTYGLMTTVHAYTNDQVLLDSTHKDPRRARAAGINIIPTKTGADKVIVQIYPELMGKIKAVALRVPVPDVSLIDFTFQTKEKLSSDSINQVFKEYAHEKLKGILEYTAEPLVSSDYIGNMHSAIFDSLLTQTLEDGFISKVFAWYDNEFGYAVRLKEFLLHNL